MKYKVKKLKAIIRAFVLSRKKEISINNLKKTYIHKGATLSATGSISIGFLEVLPNALICAAASKAQLFLGDNTYIGRNTIIASRNRVCIGNNVIIGPNVMIYDHDHNYDENGRKLGSAVDAYKDGEVIIEDNVWIGGGVIILRNSHIGRNSIIGAGTVIKGTIPENSIVKRKEELSVCRLDHQK